MKEKYYIFNNKNKLCFQRIAPDKKMTYMEDIDD